jgi:c-di-GMP-related signal transduction protein
MPNDFLVRETVLDPKQRVLGHEMLWQQAQGGGLASDADLDALAQAVGAGLHNEEGAWMLPDSLLFMEATPALLESPSLEALPPRSVVLRLTPADLAEPSVAHRIAALRGSGLGISLRDAASVQPGNAMLGAVSFLEIDANLPDLPARARAAAVLRQPAPRILARRVADWETYDRCAALGLDVAAGRLANAAPAVRKQEKAGLNASQAVILEAMKLVRANADSQKLESVMKRDPALSYKLFRYINSVGFGLGVEINSLRHAVTMLGYSTLYRWLSLLLATASTGGRAAALMQTAVLRGRFLELLGHSLLAKSEAENLFVTGMFSLLDQLLGIPMEQVLEHVQLADDVSQALLAREGVYGPFLKLAEACESRNGNAAVEADALFIGADEVNAAHLAALGWSHSVQV